MFRGGLTSPGQPLALGSLCVCRKEGWAELTAGKEGNSPVRRSQAAPSRPLARLRALLFSVSTCHFPDWLSLAVNSRAGSGY